MAKDDIYYGELLLNLLIVESKLPYLNAQEVKYCLPFIKTASPDLKRFETFPNLEYKQVVYKAIIVKHSLLTHILRWGGSHLLEHEAVKRKKTCEEDTPSLCQCFIIFRKQSCL